MPSRRIVIDHMSIGVRDLGRARASYAAALAPLGFVELNASDVDAAFGPEGIDDFVVSTAYDPGGSVHVAFAADSREQVDAFHAAALAAGAEDHGAPGVRTGCSPGYYGAFALDPDGNDVEAVFHEHGCATGPAVRCRACRPRAGSSSSRPPCSRSPRPRPSPRAWVSPPRSCSWRRARS